MTMLQIPTLLLVAADAAAEEGHKSGGLLQDTAFWVSLGFIIVILLFWRMGAHKMVAKSLDDRSTKIRNELDDARRLREEAQELLAKYQRQQREAEEEAASIIEQAKRDAERMSKEARDKINDQLERRAKAAEEKIARAEAQALAEVRRQTTDISVNAAEKIIRERMDSSAQSASIDKAISDIRSKFH